MAAIANTIFSTHSEQVKFTFIRIKDSFITSIAMGILGGCGALAIGSVDRGYLENIPLLTIFLYGFFLSLFSGAIDTWIRLLELLFKKVLAFGNTYKP